MERATVASVHLNYRHSVNLVPDILIVTDVLVIVLAALIPYISYVPFHVSLLENYVFCTGFVAVATVLMLNRSGLYEFSAIMRPIAKSDLIIASLASAFLFFLTIAFSLKVSELYSRVWIYSFAGLALVFLIGSRLIAFRVLTYLSDRKIVGRNVVVLGTGRQAEAFISTFRQKAPPLSQIVALFSPDPKDRMGEIASVPVLGDDSELEQFVRDNRVDDVIIAMPWNAETKLQESVGSIKELPVNLYLSSQLMDYQFHFNPVYGHPQALPLFEVVQRPISGWSSLIKALEDYVLSALILFLLAPLLIVVAVAIKLDSPGPVFFKQRRLGFNNKEFWIYKFRSMYHEKVPEDRVRQASRDDPRITPVGRFIRRTSIDELPQLFNVLEGTMSLVGPRPHAISHNEDYGSQIRGYFARHKVKPGITGWAQVNNLRGETQELELMAARVEHDVYYAENWSLLFDLRILFTTVVVVLFQKSAY